MKAYLASSDQENKNIHSAEHWPRRVLRRCPLVSRVEYAPHALLRLEKLDRQTDGRKPDCYITPTAKRGQRS